MSFELKGEECLEVTLGRRHSKCKGPEVGDSQVCLQVFWATGVMGSGGGWCGEASEGLGDLREEFGFPPRSLGAMAEFGAGEGRDPMVGPSGGPGTQGCLELGAGAQGRNPANRNLEENFSSPTSFPCFPHCL